MALVEVRGLSKSYGNRVAVRDLSFDVRPGCVTGFLGPNGAGKSTTVRLMLGLDRGAGGTTFDGTPYRELASPATRVGVLLDARACHPWRSARNHLRMIAAGSGIPAGRADDALEQVGLGAKISVRPRGFSLGMAQRLGLAAALLGRPDTLILDEPGNGMDPQGLAWLRTFLRSYAQQGNAVLVSSHLLAEMQTLADHVVVIGRGSLIADCPLTDFLQRYDLETVQVRSDDADRLARALTAAGGVVEHRAGDLLMVSGLDRRTIARLAVGADCLVSELFTSVANLEEAFLRASAEAVEYSATVPTT